jgi:predicted phosphodiesterase
MFVEEAMSKTSKSTIRATAIGMTIGATAMLYREYRSHKYPLVSSAQLRISRSLDSTLYLAREKNSQKLEKTSHYVIFSDHHKGARDSADDFQPCEITYESALNYYHDKGFTLVLLGDVEELWENPIQKVLDSYGNIFKSEARFYPDRYIRVVGNHDDAWYDPEKVTRYLNPLYPDIYIHQGMSLEYDIGNIYGEVFLAHGHQGTIDADYLAGIAPRILPVYRQLQNRFHIGRTTPATDDYLRGQHDTQMYRWASQHSNLIFIAGHTHRPVWSSLTHLDQLYIQLYALRLRQDEIQETEYDKQHQDLLHLIKKRISKDPPVNDTLKTKPSYFNTGCCRFSDGDITCIEISGQSISLVKWDRRTLKRMETVSMPLKELFALL